MLKTRRYLSWDEAAGVLGMDREGLRQAFADGRAGSGAPLPPVVFPTINRDFLTRLEFDLEWTPLSHWNSRESFRTACEGQEVLEFANHPPLPLSGSIEGDCWEACHPQGTGSSFTFALRGPTLMASPSSVQYACAQGGEIADLALAPRGWCKDGFPTEFCFQVLRCSNSLFMRWPESIFDLGCFLKDDVFAMAEGSPASPKIAELDPPVPSSRRGIRSDREEHLLRVIAGLWAISPELPRGHYKLAEMLDAQFADWGWDRPGKSSVADSILKAAADLPGARVRSSDGGV